MWPWLWVMWLYWLKLCEKVEHGFQLRKLVGYAGFLNKESSKTSSATHWDRHRKKNWADLWRSPNFKNEFGCHFCNNQPTEKPQFLPFFAVFWLRHLVMSPIGINLRKLSTSAQLQTFPYPTISKSFLSPPPCQISPPSVQCVAPAGQKTSNSASE